MSWVISSHMCLFFQVWKYFCCDNSGKQQKADLRKRRGELLESTAKRQPVLASYVRPLGYGR